MNSDGCLSNFLPCLLYLSLHLVLDKLSLELRPNYYFYLIIITVLVVLVVLLLLLLLYFQSYCQVEFIISPIITLILALSNE